MSKSSANEFGENYNGALRSYGQHKTHQLATMPEEQRNHVIENGIETNNGNKSIDEATTREIEEYKKQLKQRDEEKSQLESQLEQTPSPLLHQFRKIVHKYGRTSKRQLPKCTKIITKRSDEKEYL
ncbi:hypothetical protein [Staphylococcus cohnii]|uniref:hypothetical protein n=1 Tax=Staphylococcus cohnii TaxID=29382 RepID=UPI003D7C4AB2